MAPISGHVHGHFEFKNSCNCKNGRGVKESRSEPIEQDLSSLDKIKPSDTLAYNPATKKLVPSTRFIKTDSDRNLDKLAWSKLQEYVRCIHPELKEADLAQKCIELGQAGKRLSGKRFKEITQWADQLPVHNHAKRESLLDDSRAPTNGEMSSTTGDLGSQDEVMRRQLTGSLDSPKVPEAHQNLAAHSQKR